MSVSELVSDSTQKAPKSGSKNRSYGDGVIWSKERPDGRIVWYVEVTMGHGVNGRVMKTRRTVATRSEAVQLRRELNAKKIQGTLRQQVSTKFEPFAIHWVREVKSNRIRSTTAADYEYRVRQYLNPYFGSRNVSDIKPQDIQRWTSSLAKSGLSTSTINGARRILFGVFKYAQRQGVVIENPVASTDAIRRKSDEATQVREGWSKEEVLDVLTAAQKTPELDLFLHLAIHTGMRHGELLGLTWDNFDFQENSVSITHTLREVRFIDDEGVGHLKSQLNEPKTKASRRTLTLSRSVLEALERHKMWQSLRRVQAGHTWVETEYVFTTSVGTPISQTNNLKRFKKFISDSDFRYIRIHDIRHTTAVLALEAGASLDWVSQAFGHTGIEITKTIYAPYVQALNDNFSRSLSQYLQVDGGSK
jgi:integrase